MNTNIENNNTTFQCHRCGNIEKIINLEPNVKIPLCLECQKRNYVMPYHMMYPELKFYKTKEETEDTLYLGVELEVEGGGTEDYVIEQINAIMNNKDHFIYCTDDMSLRDGFEIITQPATLLYHLALIEKYTELFNALLKFGYSSDKTIDCGLHIHLNRSYFQNNEILYLSRLVSLINNHYENIVLFSRRKANTINRYCKIPITEDVKEYIYKANKSHNQKYRDYAINLSNEDTIELRFFKGTLNINTFIATLFFTKSCVDIVKKINININEIVFEDLLNTDILKEYWHSIINKNIFEE